MNKVLKTTLNEEIKRILSLPKEQQKFLWFTDKISVNNKEWMTYSMTEDDDKLVYTEKMFRLKIASHIYPMNTSKRGFSFDKRKNKIQMWWGTTIPNLEGFSKFLDETKNEWVMNEGFYNPKRLTPTRFNNNNNTGPGCWITPSVLGGILSKKITNPTDLCRKLISVNRLKGMSPEILRKIIKNDVYSKSAILSLKDIITSLDDLLDHDHHGALRDISRQAQALGKKINLRWSSRRMDEEHNLLTEELMKSEISMMEDEIVDYWGDIELPENYELITSKRRAFMEGSMMKHCIYTNYWPNIRRGEYLALAYRGEPRLTVGFYVATNRDGSRYFEFDQMSSYRNNKIDRKAEKDIIDNLIPYLNKIVIPKKKMAIPFDEVSYPF